MACKFSGGDKTRLLLLLCLVHPTPYTLHPTPYTPHPTPYTLHTTPYTPHPAPHTLHPTPYTLHPERALLRCLVTAHPADSIRAIGTSRKWTTLRMLPESGSIP